GGVVAVGGVVAAVGPRVLRRGAVRVGGLGVRVGGGGSRCAGVHGEGGGAHDAVVPEVQEEPVAAAAGRGGREGDVRSGLRGAVAGLAVGVVVQVGEVAGAQRHQVAVGAQVGLEVGDGPAVPGDGEPEVARPAGAQGAGQPDLVAVDVCGGAGLGQGARPVGAGDGEVGAEGEVAGPLPGRGEVREDPVAAGPGQVGGGAPGAVGGARGVQVTDGQQVAGGHDEVQFLVVLATVVGDGPALVVPDPEAQLRRFPGAGARGVQVEGVALLGDLESAGRGGPMAGVAAA